MGVDTADETGRALDEEAVDERDGARQVGRQGLGTGLAVKQAEVGVGQRSAGA